MKSLRRKGRRWILFEVSAGGLSSMSYTREVTCDVIALRDPGLENKRSRPLAVKQPR